jgi:hypothetical protein
MPEPLSPFRRLVIAEPGTVRIEVHRSGEPSLWAVIDIKDWDLVGQYRWRASERSDYAITSQNDTSLYMHRLILPVPDGMEVDHIDRTGLNNRRSNLRPATPTQNGQNRRGLDMRAGRPTTSRFKGVSWHVKSWTATITVNSRREYLGLYASEVEAAQVYDRRAREAFGPFALLNFPEDVAS